MNLRGPRHSQRLQISLFVGQGFDGVRDDHDAHGDEGGRRHLEDGRGEFHSILVDLFHRHVAHDGALMAL